MITSLCSRLEEAEVEVQASNLNVEKVHEELHNLQCQIATFLVQMQRISLSIENEPQIEDSTNSIQAKVSFHLSILYIFFHCFSLRLQYLTLNSRASHSMCFTNQPNNE